MARSATFACHASSTTIELFSTGISRSTNSDMINVYGMPESEGKIRIQVDLVICGLFICEFAYSHFKNWFKMPNSQSKCVFLTANSVFAVQNSGTYLPRITRPTCTVKLGYNEHDCELTHFFES